MGLNKQRLIDISAPVRVNFEITSKCNLNCIFCGKSWKSQHNAGNKVNVDIVPSISKLKKIIDILKSNQVFEITYTGGEALKYPNLIEIAKYGHQNGFEQGIITNGTLLNQNLIAKLKNFINGYGVSLHGPSALVHEMLTRMPGSFESTIEGIKLLLKNDIKFTILYTVTTLNYDKVYETAEFLKNIGVNNFVLDRFVPCGKGKKYKELIPNQNQLEYCLKDVADIDNKLGMFVQFSVCFPYCFVNFMGVEKYVGGCSAGATFGTVDYNGNLKLCGFIPQPIGNIFEQNMKELWKESSTIKYFRSLDWIPNKCKECSYLEKCRVGCKASSGGLDFGVDYYIGNPNATKNQ